MVSQGRGGERGRRECCHEGGGEGKQGGRLLAREGLQRGEIQTSDVSEGRHLVQEEINLLYLKE